MKPISGGKNPVQFFYFLKRAKIGTHSQEVQGILKARMKENQIFHHAK